MTNQPKNQHTFHIDTVGNLNTGDITIQRDQVGIQRNYTFPDPKSVEAIRTVSELLQDIRGHYPKASNTEILKIVENGFSTMRQTNLQKWRRWVDVFSIVFAGGVEAVKVVAPVLGIPIEVSKRLYEIYERNHHQLPKEEAQ